MAAISFPTLTKKTLQQSKDLNLYPHLNTHLLPFFSILTKYLFPAETTHFIVDSQLNRYDDTAHVTTNVFALIVKKKEHVLQQKVTGHRPIAKQNQSSAGE
jgi:hypothetical protein